MDNWLTSNRLTIRPIEMNDLEAIHLLHTLPETDMFNTLGIPKDIHETQRIISNWIKAHSEPRISRYTFAITLTTSKKFVGLFGLNLWTPKQRRGEIWYKIHKDHWNQGMATEAANRVLDFGFEELKLHRIQAGCAVENIGSIKVLEKIGMTLEGRGRQILPLKTGWADNFEYAILESDKRKS